MTEQEFVNQIHSINGKVYIVGGWVRDTILQKHPKDKDYVITGTTVESLEKVFDNPCRVGKSFPVYLINIDGVDCEVAFARRECKAGIGYKGFAWECTGSIEEDLFRRDTTMNSIAAELPGYRIVDPYDGVNDIKRKRIKATSVYFKDDPVRALRAARQAAELGFTIDKATILLMSACREELRLEPQERLLAELKKALRSEAPSGFFRYLCQANLLDITFPFIFALIGQTQPLQYHPEGDAFEHSMIVLDKVAKMNSRIDVRFAALVHDIGKGLTPKEELPKHIHHVADGLQALGKTNLTLPNKWLKCAEIVIKHHMRITTVKQPGKIVDFLIELSKNPIGIEGFNSIILADSGGLPCFLVNAKKYIEAIRAVHGNSAPKELQGEKIGQWVRQQQIKRYIETKEAEV